MLVVVVCLFTTLIGIPFPENVSIEDKCDLHLLIITWQVRAISSIFS